MTPSKPFIQRRTALGAIVLTLALGLSACGSAPKPTDYQAEQPAMDFRSYFSGPVQAHGMFTDRSGRVVKRFTVEMQGRWSGDSGVLEEDFTYSNGEKERRVWPTSWASPWANNRATPSASATPCACPSMASPSSSSSTTGCTEWTARSCSTALP